MELFEQKAVALKEPGLMPPSNLGSLTAVNQKSFESSLGSLFLEDQGESKIQKARAILGETVIGVSDKELAIYLTQFQHMLDDWLDGFEKQLFNDKTLQQLLQEG